MNILILGNAQDDHAEHIHTTLTQKGITAIYWDTQHFPTQLHLSWSPNRHTGSIAFPGDRTLPLETIHSVYWRMFLDVQVPPLPDDHQARVAYQDTLSLLRSLLQVPSIHWVNSWQAYQFHKEKPLQLSTVKTLGVTIPETLVSNNPKEMTEFVYAHHDRARSVIFKPVYGGAHTQKITPKHLEPQRLRLSTKISPVTLQAYIPGTNIRSYVIGETVYGAEIRTPSVDFRDDAEAEIFPIALPPDIEQQCRAIARALHLEWTAIDWRRDTSGHYFFLEANPSPMFLYFEQQTGFPITESLVQLLTH